MIKIDIEKHETRLVGTTASLTTEFILLTHSFIDSVLPRLPEDEREAMKRAIAAAFMGEIGIKTLQEIGLVGEVTRVDASELSRLMKEDGNETNR